MDLMILVILVNLGILAILVNLVILAILVILVNLCKNMISGILESSPFQKYDICWVFYAIS